MEKVHKQFKRNLIFILGGYGVASLFFFGTILLLGEKTKKINENLESLSHGVHEILMREIPSPEIIRESPDLSEIETLFLKYYPSFTPPVSGSVSSDGVPPAVNSSVVNTLTRSPCNEEALILLGRADYEEGNWESSLENFLRVIELDPYNREAWLTAVKSACGLEDFHRAAELCEGLLKFDDAASHWVLSGKCFLQLKEYSRALASVERALERDSMNLEALETKGSIYLIQKDYNKAGECYLKAASIRPERAYFLILGETAMKTEEREQAVNYWEKALALNPLETKKDQEEQLFLFEKIAQSAYESQNDKLLNDYFYLAEQWGGLESVHILQVRREKERGRTGEALKAARTFSKNYPESLYMDEIYRTIKWAKGEQG